MGSEEQQDQTATQQHHDDGASTARTPLALWAPRAKRVDVVVDGVITPLVAGDDGVHRADVSGLVAGARYGFVVDGDGPFPDPRSRSQPDGVHGLSCVVDLSSFPWTDAAFVPRPLNAAVIYELHVGTFSEAGTFDGAIHHLDHLVALGVTHVELMPVAEFHGERGWGYDGVDLFAPHHAYGGPVGLCRFVDACHRRGLAVILDVVYNHLGPSGNYLPRFAPYFTDRHHTPWGDAVNFDGEDSDRVRAFVLDNARMWFTEHHIDGLRLDAVHAIVDQQAMPLLEEVTALARALSATLQKELVVIAESDLNDPRMIRSPDAHGFGFHAQWSDDFHHALHRALTGETTGYYADYDGLADVARALSRGWIFEGQHAASRRRRHGRPFGDLPGHRLVGYAQTHDQVGNRAQGDRLASLAGPERARVALALTLTSPFVPMLFAGEEWGATTPFLYFVDHEPELARAVREGRQREFAAFHDETIEVPDPQAPSTLSRSRLRWSDVDAPVHKDTLSFTRALIALRHTLPDLGSGALQQVRCQHDAARQTLIVERGDVVVVVNLGDDAARLRLPFPAKLRLASQAGLEVQGDVAVVPRDAAAVLSRG